MSDVVLGVDATDHPSPSPTEVVLDFWFGDLDDDGQADQDHRSAWFRKNPDFDAAITTRFAWVHAQLISAGLEPPAWIEGHRDRLAAVVVLDQFSRNMFRDTPAMFASDPLARRYAYEMLALEEDRKLPFAMRSFVYMPLMHSESLAHQQRCERLLAELAREQKGSARRATENQLDFARRHADIVRRFGRFPHRNEILGRESSPEEAAFLTTPGSSF